MATPFTLPGVGLDCPKRSVLLVLVYAELGLVAVGTVLGL